MTVHAYLEHISSTESGRSAGFRGVDHDVLIIRWGRSPAACKNCKDEEEYDRTVSYVHHLVTDVDASIHLVSYVASVIDVLDQFGINEL